METHASHLYAQSRFFVFAETIHVSSQPVAPSFGIRSLTGTFWPISVFVWYGHDGPITASPFLNKLISSDASAQYFLISGFCFLRSEIAALNWVGLSSYGSLIPSDAFVFIKYSAASAI